MKHLVIVESPAKGKTIEKFLGKDYTVRASFGHVRDLVKKWLGIDIANKFQPTYVVTDDKKKTITELKKLIKGAEKVWIATDEDREGEAIGWHLCEALGLDASTVSRIVFHEITKKALEDAIAHPRNIDMNLVNAQQSRRVLDRLVGFQVSEVLWGKIRRGLSAGRVQSVAVRLVVDREREIRAFVPEESWRLTTELHAGTDSFFADFAKIKSKGKKLKTRTDVDTILSALGVDTTALTVKEDKKKGLSVEAKIAHDFTLVSREAKETNRYPAAPFTTSTLQQEASRRLGYSVGQTMSLAQRLYEAGHITYMRTDSVNLSSFIMDECRGYITKAYGKEYALPSGRKYKTKQANAQEAHEAIRPTHVDQTPDRIGVDGQEARLYRLIWERTVACQMREALVETTTYTLTPKGAPEQEWIAKGEVVKFPWFMRLYTEGTDEEEDEEGEGKNALPDLDEGAILASKKIIGRQAFSRPPARYTEAMLVKKLESEGIGRPSTYAPTIAKIVERGYVEKREKRLHPTDVAFTVNDYLVDKFKQVMEYKFTASLEDELDAIAQGSIEWSAMLQTFYDGFAPILEDARSDGGRIVEYVGRDCPKCGKELVFKFGKAGRFISCSGYPECTHVENIADEGRDETLAKLRAVYEGQPCPAGGTIVVKFGRFGPFLASSEYPEVKWITNPKVYELEKEYGGRKCPKCDTGTLHVKSSRKGPFLACDQYPDCKGTASLPKKKAVKKEEWDEKEEGEYDGE